MRKGCVLIALLLFATALGSGCASVNGAPVSSSGETAASPAPPGAPAIEATVVSNPEYRDPLIWANRAIFTFNDVAYRYLLIPLGKGYLWVTPDPVERSVGNFFYNLKTPIYVVNDALQFKPERLGRNLLRFVINSTVGLAGFFDPAQAWFGLERAGTHFDATLAQYGAGYGVYLVLPLLGPSDVRNGASRVTDYFLNPVPYLTDEPQTTEIQVYDGFQEFAPSAEPYETLRRKADDPYIFFRNLYLQGVQRDAGG
jgi:phospholipid-binding lipoprotein MlaA